MSHLIVLIIGIILTNLMKEIHKEFYDRKKDIITNRKLNKFSIRPSGIYSNRT
ncbi:MAG: hypothetical protein DK305_000486 [Chloroflexi bacterium]|jgi:hypothetical protein|nr:MAG: hypothetical protein DK305_000486 [Chloroflexota bacterium]